VRSKIVGDTATGKSTVFLPGLDVEHVLVAVEVGGELAQLAEFARREELFDGEEVGVPPAKVRGVSAAK